MAAAGAVNAATFILMFAWAVMAYRNFGKGLYEKGIDATLRLRYAWASEELETHFLLVRT